MNLDTYYINFVISNVFVYLNNNMNTFNES